MNEASSSNDADVPALRRQDARAFARLVDCHGRLIAGLCRAMGLAGADADDAQAEAFAAVYLALPRFEGRSSVATWVYRVAVRSILKTRGRSAANRRAAGALPDDLPGTARTAFDLADADETRARVWSAVAALEPRQALAIELFYRQDLGVSEIAEVLECPPGTVKTLLFRARDRLRFLLKHEGAPS